MQLLRPFALLDTERLKNRISISRLCREANTTDDVYYHAKRDPKNGTRVSTLTAWNEALDRLIAEKAIAASQGETVNTGAAHE